MTVREYIGARYVPLFMGVWDSSNTYEPLSIVQYQGNSYTSRQFVPAGIAIDNDVYWAETGNFNSQVESYRQEVLTFDNRIETNTDDIADLQIAVADETEARENADTAITAILDNHVAKVYGNLADAKAAVTANDKYVKTLAYHDGTNIGGALYKVSQTMPANYHEIADNGLYLELVNGCNVSQFGAYGDGINDDTAAIQKAVDNLDRIEFEPGHVYNTNNILISQSDKTLVGNSATLRSEVFKDDTIINALTVGTNTITVNHPEYFHVNQTALIYNASTTPTEYQIVITGINGNVLEFASYKVFKQTDTNTDSSPYYFPAGSAIYTGTTILSIMAGMNLNSYGIVKNVTIEDFIFSQPTNSPNIEGTHHWGQLAYGVLSYNVENIEFSNNHVISVNALFLMFYGYHYNVLVNNNIFENSNSSYAVCAHWDMQNISLDNRTHGFNVLDNTFYDCRYNVIYSSVDGGLCQGNRIYNDVFLSMGLYIYGGDIAIHTSYSSYDQESYYSRNVIVSDNMITAEGRKSGTGIQFLGALRCQASNNVIKDTVVGVLFAACEDIDITNNMFEYPYLAGSVDNCSIRTWGMSKSVVIHDNVFNSPRVLRVDAHNRTISTDVVSTTEYYGYTDSSIFIEHNKVKQTDATTLVWIGGTTETSHAPTVMKDVPKLLMFNGNTIINENHTSTSITVFQINAALSDFITDVTNLKNGQMCIYDNISYGLISAATKFRPYIPFEGNQTIPA